MTTLHEELSGLQPVELDAGLVFGGKASGTLVQGYADATSLTPPIDPHFRFPEASRDVIVWFISPDDPLYMFGPTGCGKSSCIRQLAARLKYPVFEVTGHGRLEFADLVGHLSLKEGNMTYEYGPLALAMRYGGLLLFNEIDLIAPEVAAGLHGVLDGSPLCISENGGELVPPHPLFRFAATANTNGGGDETGLAEEVQGLDNTLLAEVCRSADDMWRRVYEGRLEVTHKALSPLRTLHEKLTGLSFVEPHVAPIADIIRSALDRMPARGTIGGTDLLLLQGVVCLLRDSRSLVEHARKIMAGQETVSILDSLLTINDMTRDSSDEAPQLQTDDADDAPLLPEIPSLSPGLSIPGMGLW